MSRTNGILQSAFCNKSYPFCYNISMKTAYLALGANLGDKMENMREAVRLLEADGRCIVAARSSIYVTKPVEIEDQPDFVNAVVEVKTSLTPADLLKLCNDVEGRLGRERTIRWGPRVIDIDILLYEGAEVNEPELSVPHPRMMERAFVLVPLAEIAPDLPLPGGLTAREAAAHIGENGIERGNRLW